MTRRRPSQSVTSASLATRPSTAPSDHSGAQHRQTPPCLTARASPRTYSARNACIQAYLTIAFAIIITITITHQTLSKKKNCYAHIVHRQLSGWRIYEVSLAIKNFTPTRAVATSPVAIVTSWTCSDRAPCWWRASIALPNCWRTGTSFASTRPLFIKSNNN